MGDDCVPSSEMRWIGSHPDPLDAVLYGDGEGDDLLDVAAVVHDLRSAYTRTQPLQRSAELTAFTHAHPTTGPDTAVALAIPPGGEVGEPDVEPLGRKRRSVLTGLGGFVGTLTGKLVLTTAVAAASVGGLHAADVVDVPVLPDTSPHANRSDDIDNSRPDARDAAADGQDTAAENQAAADAYTNAIQTWTDCVAETAAGQGDDETRTTGAFDPSEDCGNRPIPSDFGLTDLPDQAADAAQDNTSSSSTSGPGASPEAPAPDSPGASEDAVPFGSNDPTDRGTDTPTPGTAGGTTPAPSSTVPPGNRP